MPNHSSGPPAILDVVLSLGMAFVALAYVVPARRNRRRRPWPLYRSALWLGGVAAVWVATVGPLADASHESFSAHMVGHLLLGMLAPLLLVLAAPVTLALRTLDAVPARRLSAFLRTPLVSFFTHPVVATVLSIGGLWALYATAIFPVMHDNALLMFVVNVHVFISGYLFTAAIIGVDPAPHRPGYLLRAIVLVVALAGHDILSKFLYVHPPAGVPAPQAEVGSMIMYYGGDAIDLIVIVVLCSQWFAATRPRPSRGAHQGARSA